MSYVCAQVSVASPLVTLTLLHYSIADIIPADKDT